MTAKEKVQSLIASANETTGESDTTLTDAVGTLIDGYGQGGEKIVTITDAPLNTSALPSGTYTGIDTLYYTNNRMTSNAPGTFNSVVGIKKIIMDTPLRTSMNNAFFSNSTDNALEEITIVSDTSAVTNWLQFLGRRSALKKINGTLDLSAKTNTGTFIHQCPAIKEIRFASNSIKASFQPFTLSEPTGLSAESAASLANALDPNAASKTLTFGSFGSYKNNRGRVEDGMFVPDVSGSTTLEQFITDTKGWTVVT